MDTDVTFSKKLVSFIQDQKYILILVLFAVVAMVFLLIFVHEVKNSKTTTSSGSGQANQTLQNSSQNKNNSIVSKIASVILHTGNQAPQNAASGSAQSISSGQSTANTQNASNGNSENQSSLSSGSTSESQGSGQGTNDTSNGLGNQSPSDNQSNDPNQTNFQIIFSGPDGPEPYVPPTTPPTQVTWATYTDNTYHYSIQYPANWQIVNGQTAFSKGLTLFLPGEDTSDITQKYIAFGWSNYNLYPAIALNNDESTTSPALVTGVTGTIYTKGPMGVSYIVSIFPYESGYFGLITYSSDPDIAYIYQYMLESLTFNIQ